MSCGEFASCRDSICSSNDQIEDEDETRERNNTKTTKLTVLSVLQNEACEICTEGREMRRCFSSSSKSVDGHFLCLCVLCDLSVLSKIEVAS